MNYAKSSRCDQPWKHDPHGWHHVNDEGDKHYECDGAPDCPPKLFAEVHRDIELRPGYRLLLERDKAITDGRWYYQIECDRPDIYTKEMGVGRGGKAYLTPHATESELVQLAFGLLRAYDEHEDREWFRWKGRAVFGPHIDVRSHWRIAEELSFREGP